MLQQDPYGNTALHLACMLGRKEAFFTLLRHYSKDNVPNIQGWTAYHECVSLGQRDMIAASLVNKLRRLRDQVESWRERRHNLLAEVAKLPNCKASSPLSVS